VLAAGAEMGYTLEVAGTIAGGCRMDSHEWLLLYVAMPVPGQVGLRPVEPIQIMKGMFLFVMETGDALYRFQPYLYGPFSSEVYRDLDRLIAEGFLRAEPVPGQTWSVYTSTENGRERAGDLFARAPRGLVTRLENIKQYVTGTSFSQLLRDIYRRYPQFAPGIGSAGSRSTPGNRR
jgi:hypothetical protein